MVDVESSSKVVDSELLEERTLQFGPHYIKLQKFYKDIHFPSKVGLLGGEALYEASKSKPLGFHPNNIHSVCDLGIGAGHYAILSSKLFPNCEFVFGVDILKTANLSAHNNWLLNVNEKTKKVKFSTITCDINDAFVYFRKNRIRFSCLLCNLPNIGPSSGGCDPFSITVDDDGRYGINSLLSNAFSVLTPNGYVITTDTTLNYSWKTDVYLENVLHLKRNVDWLILKKVKMNLPFLEHSSPSQSWVQNMIKTKRILVGENGEYYQIRRYILIKKPGDKIRAKL